MATAARPVPASAPALHELVFTGTGRDYFRIWIVNVLLTVATLGVFSAWAKVRRTQYFYRHLRLADAGFDYHAAPMAILRGRAIAVILVAAYWYRGFASPWVAVAIVAVLALALPWLLCRSLAFRLRNTSYRGIRFHFSGTTRAAYWVFLGLPVLTVLSFLVLGPLWHHRLKRYQHAHAAFGATPFSFSASAADFYQVYVRVVGIAIVSAIVLTVGLVFIGAGVAAWRTQMAGSPSVPIVAGLGLAGFAAAYLAWLMTLQAVHLAAIQNLVWQRTAIGDAICHLDIEPARLSWILFSNLLGTLATLGLYRPFAQVRLMEYLTSRFALVGITDFDGFAARPGHDVSAVGEGAADLFDVDIGL